MEELPRSALLSANSGSAKPSRLLQPGSLKKKPVAKRELVTEDKEVPVPSLNITDEREGQNAPTAPPAKRQKISAPTTTTTTKKSAPAKSSATTSRSVTSRPPSRTGTSRAPATSTVGRARGKATTTTSRAPAGQAKAPAKGKEATSAAPSKGSGNGNGKKRPAWDLKGRLQDMEHLMATERTDSTSTIKNLSEQLQLVMERLDHMESVKVEQEGTLKQKQEETTMAAQKIATLEHELCLTKTKYQAETDRFSSLERDHASLKRAHTSLEDELAATRRALSQITAESSTLQCRFDAMKIAKEGLAEESARKSTQIASLEEAIQEHLSTIAQCEGRIREDEMSRRRLHNAIQELKGNIRVFCRVRPFLPGEQGRASSSDSRSNKGEGKLGIEFPDQDQKKIELDYTPDQATTTGSSASAKSYTFEFDRIFSPTSSQEAVFGEISQLVQSALDGYNVCIFAYGQTGSGKTYTMEGPEKHVELEGEEDPSGMIPRAVRQVFQSARALQEQGWQYKLEASFLEIYNESIRDLLASGSTPTSHDIKLDPAYPGGVYVTNVTPTPVTSQAQVAKLLEKAAQNRAVAATNCNERSSRSHSVFRLQLTGSNEITNTTCKGTLNLVDLAGSERLTQSGSVGDRLKETKSINKSLSTLGQVIMSLANKDQHVPYRNSKLTYLLQNSLGGNSKTLMFVNMSPLATSFQETLCSLRFATKVNQCNIGTARKSSK